MTNWGSRLLEEKLELFEIYLMMHKYGMPMHGCLGLGLERFASRLLGYKNQMEKQMIHKKSITNKNKVEIEKSICYYVINVL